MNRMLRSSGDKIRLDCPESYNPAEELLRAVIRQSVYDVTAGPETGNKLKKFQEEAFYNYHTAKAFLQTQFEAFLDASGLTRRDAQTFLENN